MHTFPRGGLLTYLDSVLSGKIIPKLRKNIGGMGEAWNMDIFPLPKKNTEVDAKINKKSPCQYSQRLFWRFVNTWIYEI